MALRRVNHIAGSIFILKYSFQVLNGDSLNKVKIPWKKSMSSNKILQKSLYTKDNILWIYKKFYKSSRRKLSVNWWEPDWKYWQIKRLKLLTHTFTEQIANNPNIRVLISHLFLSKFQAGPSSILLEILSPTMLQPVYIKINLTVKCKTIYSFIGEAVHARWYVQVSWLCCK